MKYLYQLTKSTLIYELHIHVGLHFKSMTVSVPDTQSIV